MTTAARDRLAAGQQRVAALNAQVAGMWSAAAAGTDVNPATLVNAEAEAAVATRMLPTFQTLAAAEVEAEQRATWATAEAGALAEHQQLATDLAARLDTARTAMAAVVDAALAVDRQAERFALDARRPPVLVDGYPQQHTDRHRTTSGETIRGVGAGDAVLALAADGLDYCADRGERAWGEYHQQFVRIRTDAVLPASPRKAATP